MHLVCTSDESYAIHALGRSYAVKGPRDQSAQIIGSYSTQLKKWYEQSKLFYVEIDFLTSNFGFLLLKILMSESFYLDKSLPHSHNLTSKETVLIIIARLVIILATIIHVNYQLENFETKYFQFLFHLVLPNSPQRCIPHIFLLEHGQASLSWTHLLACCIHRDLLAPDL